MEFPPTSDKLIAPPSLALFLLNLEPVMIAEEVGFMTNMAAA